MNHGISVSKPPTSGFSIQMSDTIGICFQSIVPVDVAKSWSCTTRVASLVNLIFHFPSVQFNVPPDSHAAQDSNRSLLPTLSFYLRRPFDSFFQLFRLKLSSLSCSEFFGRSTEGSFFDLLCFFGIKLLDVSLSLGILRFV